MMKKPEIQEPRKTRKAEVQCIQRESRFSPKRKRPRKADSRKKEKIPSMASGIPMTPPVRRENSAQLVPNWNSMGIPVTTPSRKFTAKILAQKRAATSYFASSRLQRQRLQHDDEQRQAHGELGEEVVIGDGEGEVDPVKG